MAKIIKHVYIKENMDLIKRLIKSGDVSTKVINDYSIYCVYSTLKGMKMQRYQDTADCQGVSTLTVMKAVKSMETKI